MNILNLTFINSPLEQFEVTSLIGLSAPIFGYFNLTLTNLALYCFLVLFLVIGLHVVANNNAKLVPSKWSIALESSFASVSSMVRDQIGSLNEVYLPFIYSLFFFILIANLTGNVPYSYTITTSIIVTIGLSFTILIGVTILGLYIHKVRFFAFFIPSGTPLALVPLLVLIELLSYSARAFSLGIRLFANMCAGHTLLKILSKLDIKREVYVTPTPVARRRNSREKDRESEGFILVLVPTGTLGDNKDGDVDGDTDSE